MYLNCCIPKKQNFIAAYLKSAETHLKLGNLAKAKEHLKASLNFIGKILKSIRF
jgi:hypothetical protein